jgi:hypothetical protein
LAPSRKALDFSFFTISRILDPTSETPVTARDKNSSKTETMPKKPISSFAPAVPIIPKTYGDTLAGLKSKRSEAITELEDLKFRILLAGHTPHGYEHLDGPPEPKREDPLIRPDGAFTPLGILKINEIFDYFDSDRDNLLNFLEFRGYLQTLNRLEDFSSSLMDNVESFSVYIADMFDTERDIFSGEVMLTRKGFIMYRSMSENKHELLSDLIKLGFDYRDPTTARWLAGKAAFESFAVPTKIDGSKHLKIKKMCYFVHLFSNFHSLPWMIGCSACDRGDSAASIESCH